MDTIIVLLIAVSLFGSIIQASENDRHLQPPSSMKGSKDDSNMSDSIWHDFNQEVFPTKVIPDETRPLLQKRTPPAPPPTPPAIAPDLPQPGSLTPPEERSIYQVRYGSMHLCLLFFKMSPADKSSYIVLPMGHLPV